MGKAPRNNSTIRLIGRSWNDSWENEIVKVSYSPESIFITLMKKDCSIGTTTFDSFERFKWEYVNESLNVSNKPEWF